MSSQSRRFISFAEFEPDTVDFDNPKLDVAENVTPSYGAYRPIESLQMVNSVADTNPLTGGYVHLSGQVVPNMHLSIVGTDPDPTQTNVITWFDREGTDIDELDDYGKSMVEGFEPDNSTYITAMSMEYAASTSSEYWAQIEEPPRTPSLSATGDVTIKVRLRYLVRADAYDDPRVDYELWEDTGGAGTTICSGTWTVDDTVDDAWQDFEYELDHATEATAVTDWSKLYIKIAPYFNTGPAADVNTLVKPIADEYLDTGWVTDDGGTSDLFEHIDYYQNGFWAPPTIGTDAEYIESPSLSESESSTVIFRFDALPLPLEGVLGATYGHHPYATVLGEDSDVNVKLRVIQPAIAEEEGEEDTEEDYWVFSDHEFTVLAEGELGTIGTITEYDGELVTAPPQVNATATPAEWIERMDPSRPLYVAITCTYNGGTGDSTSLVTLSPTNADVAKDSGDGTSVTTNVPSGVRTLSLPLASGSKRSDPDSGANHKIWVRAKSNVAGQLLGAQIRTGSSGYVDGNYNSAWTLTTSYAWYSYTMRAGSVRTGIAGDAPYDDLILDLRGTATAAFTVSEAYLEYPANASKARVYALSIDPGNRSTIDVSSIKVEAKDPKDTATADYNVIITGTLEDLYEVTQFGWTSLTNTGGSYGDAALNSRPKLWSFTSWGDDIIASNYADPIQKLSLGSTNFADLYNAGSTYNPQFRHIAVIGGHLVGADVNPDDPAAKGYSGGKPYHIWCSHLLDPTNWDAADYDNQSAIFPLVGRPGAITGLIGGEYGWVFKRNSVWRMTYVGLPPIFQFDLVLDGVGCDHPQSIVQAGGNIYWWGGGGIHVMGQNGYRRLSGARIEKYLFDVDYEETAINVRYTDDPVDNESGVWGAYDGYSGLIWWVFRDKDCTHRARMNRGLIYSVAEDRFTGLRRGDWGTTLVLGSMNVLTGENKLNRSMHVFKYTSAGTRSQYYRFIADQTWQGTLKTKVISPVSWGEEVGKDAEIIAVRPLYVSQSAADSSGVSEMPDFKITIEAAQEPSMNVGYDTRVLQRRRENRQGWIPCQPINGEFWRFTVQIPPLWRGTVKEFLGLQFLTNRRGDG